MAHYVLRPRPPVRAFAAAAVASLLGGTLMVVTRAQSWSGWLILAGAVLLGAGIGLLVAALISMRAMRVAVDLDDQGYWIHGPGIDERGSWREVTKVATGDGGSDLVFVHPDGERTHLWIPMGSREPATPALTADIAAHLNQAYGYRHMIDEAN